MSITATAKAKLYVGTTAAATTLTQYEADTFTEVKELSDLGEFGDQAEEIKFSTISDARVRKLKGIRDAGTLEIVVGRDASDAGQIAMRAAKNDDFHRNFKVVINDAPSGGTPTTFFFRGLVMGGRAKLGTGNDIVTETFSIAINSEILEVPAAA